MQNKLFIFLIIIFIISCSPFKERYFNKLSDKKKQKYLVNSIDTEKHSEQKNDTLYTLNISELEKIVKNSSNNPKISDKV